WDSRSSLIAHWRVSISFSDSLLEEGGSVEPAGAETIRTTTQVAIMHVHLTRLVTPQGYFDSFIGEFLVGYPACDAERTMEYAVCDRHNIDCGTASLRTRR